MRRWLAFAAVVLAVAAFAGCGGGKPAIVAGNQHVWVVSATPHQIDRLGGCVAADCGTYAVNFGWQLPPFTNQVGYDVLVNGTQFDTTTNTSYVFYGMDCNTTYTLGANAYDGSNNKGTVYTLSYTTPACGAVPTNTAEPVVSGTIATGDVLTSTTGSWSGSPTSYTYQWQDCATDGTSCSNIGGATASTYTVASGDAGHTIESVVTAHNATGTGTADAPIVPLVDNFGGSSVDTNIWNVANNQGDTSNGEIECYLPGQTAESSGAMTQTLANVASFTCPAGTPIGTLSGSLSTGSPITSIPMTAQSGISSNAIPTGSTVTLTSGAHTQNFTSSGSNNTGGSSIAVSSQTPNFAYPTSTIVTAPTSLVWKSGATQEIGTAFQYGTITASIQWAGGDGWSALWLLGANCQGAVNQWQGLGFYCNGTPPTSNWDSDSSDAAEVDIAEIFSANSTTTIKENIFNSTGSGGGNLCNPTISTATTAKHVYQLIWTATSLTWKIDGTTECTNTTDVPTNPMFLIIDTAQSGGGTSGGTTTVDYVHASH